MSEAGIKNAAELERRWVERFDGNPLHVHRQVMRLPNQTKRPRAETLEKLAALTGVTPSYFTVNSSTGRLPVDSDRLAVLEGDVRELFVRVGRLADQVEDLARRVPPGTAWGEAAE